MKKFLDAKTLSPRTIARKHGISLSLIMNQLKMGKKVEREHTSNLKATREIALDHLGEVPNYYTKLKKVEEEISKLGTRVKVKSNKSHDKMTSGKEGIIKEIGGPALGVKFDKMKGIHRWYTSNELNKIKKEEQVPKQLREVVENLIEEVSRAHFQAAVNHILLHPKNKRDALAQAHIKILSSLNPRMKPERFIDAIKRGIFYKEKMTLPKLRQQHFEAVAEHLRNMSDGKMRKELGVHYMGIFTRSNPTKFDEQKFVNAAALNEDLRDIVEKE